MASNNPYVIEQESQQQDNQNPMNMMQNFQGGGNNGLSGLLGGGSAIGAGSLGSMGGGAAASGAGAGGATGAISGAGGGAGAGIASVAGSTTAGASSGATAGGSALASNPVGWIIAAALAQNVAHNKGISSWGDAFRGTSARKAGDHFMDQWGLSESNELRDVAGVLGWGSKGGVLNPSYINEKLFE